MTNQTLADLPAFPRAADLLKVVPFARATLFRKVRNGSFPRPFKASERVTCWNRADVEAWFAKVAA